MNAPFQHVSGGGWCKHYASLIWNNKLLLTFLIQPNVINWIFNFNIHKLVSLPQHCTVAYYTHRVKILYYPG